METRLADVVRVLADEGLAPELVPADAEAPVRGVSPLGQPRPGTLVFSVRAGIDVGGLDCAAVIGPRDLPAPPAGGPAVVRVDDPRLAFVLALHRLAPAGPAATIDPTASVADGCVLDPGVGVGAYAVLAEGVRVGPRSRIGAHAVLETGTRVGADCEIGAGSVLGAPGFGYVRRHDRWLRFPHVGGVVLEDDVHVGALCTVDRGALVDTVVRRGTRLDSHVHVAHNADVGPDVVICAGATLGGTTAIGAGAFLGLGSLVSDRVGVGARAQVPLGGVVVERVPDDARLVSLPALELGGLARLLRVARGTGLRAPRRPR